ncbi:hypothetical protein TrRE_jg4725 [Triparma retinervis]|jgi:hypothetical protein|uniref:Uncharacterized protein n=1 Tax=Triparma retinervis TaxID=2557542 RepID=A0A9W7C532_9STRA|nr:hypothetical protein TrRE_jg4725 [Triparma retinervis]
MILYNSTADYCGLGKAGMAEEAFSCPWPHAPSSVGGDCSITWLDYVGRDIAFVSNVIFSAYFGVGLLVATRMQFWVHQRLKSKGLNWSARTVNEWLSAYMFVVCALRLTMELGYGNEGFLSFQVQFIFQKTIAGILLISPYTLTWGWYKVTLQPSEKRKKGKRADQIHLAGVLSTMFLEIGSGIMGIVLLPEKYQDAGVYVGNANAICRIIIWVYLASVGRVCVRMGRGIEERLASGGKVKDKNKNQEKDPKTGRRKEIKEATKRGKEEAKIAILVSRTFVVIVLILLYFIYDIYSSMGKHRHVTVPMCKTSSVFVRLPTFCHILVTSTVLIYFGVKDPAAKKRKKVSPSGTSTWTTTTTSSTMLSPNMSSRTFSPPKGSTSPKVCPKEVDSSTVSTEGGSMTY